LEKLGRCGLGRNLGGQSMYKKASLRTGGSNLAGKARNTRKATQPNYYRVKKRKLRQRTGKGVPSAQDGRIEASTSDRRKWTPYIEMCVKAGVDPAGLPPSIKAQVKQVGSLRKWLARYAIHSLG
jgi:hypothetical protein